MSPYTDEAYAVRAQLSINESLPILP